MSPNIAHGTLGHTYQITVIDLVCETPRKLYAASVEGLEAIPLSQIAREIEKQLGEHGFLVGIEDLSANVMVLDMTTAPKTEQEPG